jgi:hypothetical protein
MGLSELKSLGWMNGWTKDGEERKIVKECQDKKHRPKEVGSGRCVSTIVCNECKYVYKIDSSD